MNGYTFCASSSVIFIVVSAQWGQLLQERNSCSRSRPLLGIASFLSVKLNLKHKSCLFLYKWQKKQGSLPLHLKLIMVYIFQGLWLLPAYYLEFEGKNTFIYIWMAGLIFYCINLYVMYVIIDSYCLLPRKQIASQEPKKLGKKYSRHFRKRQKIS